MIECIFTIDYEIYGNGEGTLRELVYEPTERLRDIFLKWDARFVLFVEVAELEVIEESGSDSAINLVKHQIRNLDREGFDLGLHLHPQWYNARWDHGKWSLDYSEYNLCTLPRERIIQIVDRSINYFRDAVNRSDFVPLSFRAGNWLFQPTQTAASVLVERGIKVDSSVFKGGRQHRHNLDYRRALRNGYYWMFNDHVDIAESREGMLELPIYTQMVPLWKMITAKRIGLQRQAPSTNQSFSEKLYRILDFLRIWHPMKFDFCRMAKNELTSMLDAVVREDQQDPGIFRPIVAIGHTKDLVDFSTVEYLLHYLRKRGIGVSTFSDVFPKCKS